MSMGLLYKIIPLVYSKTINVRFVPISGYIVLTFRIGGDDALQILHVLCFIGKVNIYVGFLILLNFKYLWLFVFELQQNEKPILSKINFA